MRKKVREQVFREVEQAQAELRKCIEKTKELAADSDHLLGRATPQLKPTNPVS